MTEPCCTKSEDGVVIFWCPGCKSYHGVWTEKPNSRGGKWSFNGDFIRPTFQPSILVHEGERTPRCHSYVTDGQIQFLDDCGHALAGKTVRIPTDAEIKSGEETK